jgi:antitoxin PrlF
VRRRAAQTFPDTLHDEELASGISKMRSVSPAFLSAGLLFLASGNTMLCKVLQMDQGMSTTVTTKGQVTIPKQLRDYLGLGPGSLVDFDYTADGQVVIRPVKPAPKGRKRSRFTALRGSGKGLGMSTDEYMNLIRGYDEDKDDPGFKNLK